MGKLAVFSIGDARGRALLAAIGVGLLWASACSLNPQPAPPARDADRQGSSTSTGGSAAPGSGVDLDGVGASGGLAAPDGSAPAPADLTALEPSTENGDQAEGEALPTPSDAGSAGAAGAAGAGGAADVI